MIDGLEDFVEITNGAPAASILSDAELRRRLAGLRGGSPEGGPDAVRFVGRHDICYHAGSLPCGFRRRFGLLGDADESVPIAAAIDAGQPRRRAFCDPVPSYTGRRRDHSLEAVALLMRRPARPGIGADAVELRLLDGPERALPGRRWRDASKAAMRMRMIKSGEEIDHDRRQMRGGRYRRPGRRRSMPRSPPSGRMRSGARAGSGRGRGSIPTGLKTRLP